MNTEVFKIVWGEASGCVFIPRIKGWSEDEVTHKLKAITYKESVGISPSAAIGYLEEHADPSDGQDYYFTPLVFKKAPRKLYNAPDMARILWADLDAVDPRTLTGILQPAIAWHSSAAHYQAIWLLDKDLPIARIEALNKQLSYKVGADKSGWDLTQILRIPGSINYKYAKPQDCTLLWCDSTIVTDAEKLEAELGVIKSPEERIDDFTELKGLVSKWIMPPRAVELLLAKEAPLGERSDRLWELEKLLVKAEIPVAVIVSMIKLSVWNKFKDRKDGDAQLLKETLKAELEYKTEVKPETPVSSVITHTSDVMSFMDFMGKETTAPEFLVDNFVQKASVGVCAGEPKTMKSTMMLDLAISVASGKPFFNRYKVQPCPVMYIQEENSEADIKSRIIRIACSKRVMYPSTIGHALEPIPLYVLNNSGLNLSLDTDRQALVQMVKDRGIQLLILDPWYMMCAGIDENVAKDVSPILKFLTTIRNDYKCAVILVHHFKKGEAVRGGQRMRGSTVFHAWVETGIYAELNKGIPGDIIVEREFRSFPSPSKVNVIIETDTTYNVRIETMDSYLPKPSPEPETKPLELTLKGLLDALKKKEHNFSELVVIFHTTRAMLRDRLEGLRRAGMVKFPYTDVTRNIKEAVVISDEL